jgi:hypothetical protein
MEMSVKEFIKKKNKIIYDEFGITLVPEDQIEECPKHKLDTYSAIRACPYCVVYVNDRCVDCPMYKAGNECNSVVSTWSNFHLKLGMNLIEFYESNKKIQKLYAKYNKQFKEKSNDSK